MEKTNVTTTETTNVTPPAAKRRYWWKAIASFLMVLFTMPLGHGLMIIMEHLMSETVLHYSAFVMGAVGMAMVIVGVFAKGDTRQTLWGFFGGLLFWTGWVEFLFMYFANRFGTQPELDPVTGEIVTRPEYLILPASFGFWMMIMVMYLFSTKNGCNFINWWQRLLFRGKKNDIAARPMTRHTSIVTFMELMMLLWTSYLLLMFCYDDVFLGENHPVTLLVGVGCFIGSFFIFATGSAPGVGLPVAITILCPCSCIFIIASNVLSVISFCELVSVPSKSRTRTFLSLPIFVLIIFTPLKPTKYFSLYKHFHL